MTAGTEGLAARRASIRALPRLALLPALTLVAMLGPLVAGLYGVILPALGYFPAAGAAALEIRPFAALADWPGLWPAMRLSLTTGLLATMLSLGVAALVVAGTSGTRGFRLIERLLSPLLSVPHAAAAFGLAFLIAPSGWIARGLAPVVPGWAERPPDLLILQDPLGLSLVAGLVAKEVPFLLLMTLAALGQVQAPARMALARTLGYGPVTGWLKAVFPGVYARIRLPVYVVLAYSMSVVDTAIILGPNTPPTLSVQILRWMSDPDLGQRQVAAAAALVQLGLVLGALGLWRVGELAVARFGCRWVVSGRRGRYDGPARVAGLALGLGSGVAVFAGLLALVLWSVAGRWTYPDLLPEALSLRSWVRHGATIWQTAGDTLLIAVAATAMALILTIGCLEAEERHGLRLTRRGLWLLYLPLLLPQTAFLPGLQLFLIGTGVGQGMAAVIAAHLVFVLPYVFLSLGDPWRAWDRRYAAAAVSLGAGPERILWRVRLPMLLRPVLTAAAVGMAVSVGQYLPTLLAGGGRVQTLTTEAVALAAGGDRRAIGVFAVLQTLLALLPFGLALGLPALLHRNRRGLGHG